MIFKKNMPRILKESNKRSYKNFGPRDLLRMCHFSLANKRDTGYDFAIRPANGHPSSSC